MNNIIKSRISIFLFSIIISYLLSDVYENILGFILILSIGVIHGANDLLIIKNYTLNKSIKGQFLYFFYYVSIVLLGFLFFYVLPALALVSFILISIYHFGEQYWEVNLRNTKINRTNKLFLIISHGLIFFITIFMNNLITVNEVLTSFNFIELNYSSLLIAISLFLFIYIFILLKFKNLRKFLLNEILFFFLLFILTINATLIYGFAIYFIFFHSILSIKDQVRFIYNDDSKENIRNYIKISLPYFFLALSFLFVFYFTIDLEKINLLQILFTFIAAITFPHVIVIEKMYRHMK